MAISKGTLITTRALKCKPSAQITRDDREVYCNYQVVDVYISGIVKSLVLIKSRHNALYINFEVSHVECVKWHNYDTERVSEK